MELSKDVSLLILVPPPEDVCSCPGEGDIFSDNDRFLSIPVPVFEMSKFNQLIVKMFLSYRPLLLQVSSCRSIKDNPY